METVTLIVAITALALILILFIGNIINNGLSAAFNLNIRAKKYAVVLLIMYAVSISGFVLLTRW
ncbi:hypothetical protein OHJ21_23020 [Virgibacillus sp. LDC1]|uniref:hypothetical protein n=1 Tax=Paenibacillus TaxID=44249 RepID=UPI000C276912|nr:MULTISPECIES: hypothetical protein [Paenibacillus]MCV4234042.1 hypothetical protein [Virgibacillus sp. LDC1]MEC0254189.1 hypothetical protein [Paenibacillus lautus]MEC0308478.1 hypothetical protein [Paenibacillus lautus]PJN51650.1 hypothetical protein PAEVO_47420 [Paenibacillus sp. GM2FR]